MTYVRVIRASTGRSLVVARHLSAGRLQPTSRHPRRLFETLGLQSAHTSILRSKACRTMNPESRACNSSAFELCSKSIVRVFPSTAGRPIGRATINEQDLASGLRNETLAAPVIDVIEKFVTQQRFLDPSVSISRCGLENPCAQQAVGHISHFDQWLGRSASRQFGYNNLQTWMPRLQRTRDQQRFRRSADREACDKTNKKEGTAPAKNIRSQGGPR
jgi:hypothetical protein